MKRTVIAIASVLAVVGVGCAEDSEPTPRATVEPVPTSTETSTSPPVLEEATPTPEPEPETAPSDISIEEAADQYVKIVGPVNAAAAESEAYWWSDRYQDAARVMIEPVTQMIEDLETTEWPGDVARLVDQLIELTKEELAAYERVVNASSERQAEDRWWELYTSQEARGAVSSAIRVLLDLPQIN